MADDGHKSSKRSKIESSSSVSVAGESEGGSSASARGNIYLIRGPPGCGKSSVAKALLENLRGAGRNVAYLEQDHFRGGIMGDFGAKPEIYGPILVGAARSAIAAGVDAVVEGMLTLPKNMKIIEQIAAIPTCKVVYLSVDLDEALRRHAGREKSNTVPAEDIIKWSASCTPSGLPNEIVINNIDKDETIRKILSL